MFQVQAVEDKDPQQFKKTLKTLSLPIIEEKATTPEILPFTSERIAPAPLTAVSSYDILIKDNSHIEPLPLLQYMYTGLLFINYIIVRHQQFEAPGCVSTLKCQHFNPPLLTLLY